MAGSLSSLNWIGLVILLVIIGVGRFGVSAQKLWLVAFSILLPCMYLNNYWLLKHPMAEVKYGLQLNLGDQQGESLYKLCRDYEVKSIVQK